MMKNVLIALGIIAGATNFTKAQNVNIPDANFKAYLVGSSAINTNGDSEISVGEAAAFTGGMACYNKGISDLTGIEAFTNVTMILCYRNQLTSLDVSKNIALKQLNCDQNQLTSLDVSKNIALESLSFALNKLTSIDVSKNTSLTLLDCQINRLTSLDVSKNTALQTLYCHYNQLTVLDVSTNIALKYLWSFNNQLTSLNIKNGYNSLLTAMLTQNNPNLTCIQVDNVANSNSYNGWNKDAIANYTENFATCGLAVTTAENLKLSIFPNPVKDILNLVSEKAVDDVSIYNVEGKLVKSFEDLEAKAHLDLSKLITGIYVMRVITSDGKIKSFKIIKK